MSISPRILIACLLLVALMLPVYADDMATQVQALVAKQAPSVVTVRAVLKTEFKGGGSSQSMESRSEMVGVIVDSSGLVMISSLPFSTDKMMEMMGMPKGAGDTGIKITPTSFKVVFERDPKEYPAFLAATDTTLGLSFLRIEDLGGRTVTPVLFADTPSPALGDQLFAISRLSNGYDYAPYFESARVSGTITKPRPALILDGNITEIGQPLFTLAGEPIGVLTSISSGVKSGDDDAQASMAMMMRMFGGGGGNRPGLFVVPGSAVSVVIAQAKTRADDLAKTRAAAPATPTPATPAAPPK